MKTRNGLVSNSSSASFVIAGYKIKRPKDDKQKLELITKLNPTMNISNLSDVDDIFIGVLNGYHDIGIIDDHEAEWIYFGKIFADVHSDGDFLDRKTYDMNEITVVCDQVKKLFSFDEPFKIYTGTRCC